ncbi:hypothetical protein HPB49_019993 [Dermacentor silvarum]|uniref:Uncharacterized protein n=1 Tax=Dermacentor silvarum TaxID=543639 RepID=A0ACB8CHA9_DERSI|nr:hypothetical protein HPB49_019993 [Dermacentor silvarum]
MGTWGGTVGKLPEFDPDAGNYDVYLERLEYRFRQRKQEKHKSVSDFIVVLKKLAATCAFGALLEEAPRDRLIAGLLTDDIRCRLSAMPDAEQTWERTCTIAVSTEAATKDTQQMVSTNREVLAAGVPDLYWQREAAGRRLQASAGKNASSSQFAKAEKTACLSTVHRNRQMPRWYSSKHN